MRATPVVSIPDASGCSFLQRRPSAILVAIARESAATPVIERAARLAVRLDARLFVVHLLSRRRPLLEREDDVREVVRRSLPPAVAERLPSWAYRIAITDPWTAIRSAAEWAQADLLVLDRGLGSDELAPDLVSIARQPVLVAGAPRDARRIVAGVDLRAASLPVLSACVRLATALESRLTIVHSVEETASAASRALAAMPPQAEALERIAHAFPPITGANIVLGAPAATAIDDVATQLDADVAVVGMRRGGGTTLRSLLARSDRSLLAIPFALDADAAPTLSPIAGR
jgi:K+-sensing histidine kinase KdpD